MEFAKQISVILPIVLASFYCSSHRIINLLIGNYNFANQKILYIHTDRSDRVKSDGHINRFIVLLHRSNFPKKYDGILLHIFYGKSS